jgi:3-phenylpropionate/trans-cinnamate dioxygenase ferredoxin reductase subunit
VTDQAFVIVGAGLAGAKAAQTLRDLGCDGSIILIGDERERPYERPPLSKDYLLGKSELDSVYVHSRTWYADHGVQLRLGQPVTVIDKAQHQVELADGARLDYSKLLLTTGSSPRLLPVPGADAQGVYYLRRIVDSQRIKESFGLTARLLVIGGGWIGLEVTAAARQAGLDVTLVEQQPLPLFHVLGPELAQVFADLHTEHGVTIRTGVGVDHLTTVAGRVTGAQLSDGTHIDADAVVVGIGVTPNTELAEAAGLDVNDGVEVDAALRTTDPDIFAAGDIARAYHPVLGQRIRVEHWANALNQPATAAVSMLGREAAYDTLPYFYTDQYDLGMEYHGYVAPGDYDQVVFRGDQAQREFIAFWLRAGRVRAGMNVNVWDVGEPVKALIRSGAPVDADRLADLGVPLDQV